MKIKNSFTLNAPLQEVWDFLLNVEEMSKCIPGVEGIEMIDERTYRGVLGMKIGPISAKFQGVVTFIEIESPTRLVAEIKADDKASSSNIKATFISELEAIDKTTKINYQVDLNLRGRLAQFGSAVVQGTAKKMTSQFGRCVQKSLDVGE
jgi:uncharacterized protein